MDDSRIIDLYFMRDERAIEATGAKYGKLLYHVSYRILHSDPDVEECVNDTYMKAWSSIPPERPSILSAFLSRITRNLSINRYLANKSRSKIFANSGILDEMAECIPDNSAPISDDLELKEAFNGFLESLNIATRKIFVKRYFYMMSVREIATDMKLSVSNVKVSLMRTREKFKAYLEKAGISI